ncbi:MAG: DUF305 domain-containing protein [Pseudohongiella sp.]|nr:DUF305 domain-containing protein [Pseudohongiella sp.]
MLRHTRLSLAISALSLFAAGQALAQPPIIQPGAPGQVSRQISVEEASALAGTRVTDADITFMQDMIMHHDQAVQMTAMIEGRSQRDEVRQLGERISASQDDEMQFMVDWLEEQGQPVMPPAADRSAHAHHSGHSTMAGMLTDAELANLRAAQGNQFDTLFMQYMIKHHQGAITMVDELLAKQGTAQDPVLFEFISEVKTEQNSEIKRMTAMLATFSPDPRVGLGAGYYDAGQASMNMNLLAALPKPDGFFDPANPMGLPMSRLNQAGEAAGKDDDEAEPRPSLLDFANTDMAFSGDVMIAGNYHGFNAYDISNPLRPVHLSSVVCPGGQGDVSVVGNLLIMSVEQNRGRLDCGLEGVAERVSGERFRGIRIFDVSDFRMPSQVAAVQTCRGSHTHTVVNDPDDDGKLLVYISGTSYVRPGEELEGCVDESPFKDENSARFRIEVVEIPVNNPEDARIVSRPQVFADPVTGVIASLWEGGDHGPDTNRTGETNHCHDITAFPQLGVAAGACSGNGILFDISDPLNPQRLDQVIDTGFAYWHSATFNNDGTKVLFTDEWGGGSRARCRSFDPMNWGGNAIYDIVDGKLEFRAHYKMPAPQSEEENCVAHNGSLVPVPGRDIFVQSWYQGGISVMDFTDSSNPREIAFFDRGPVDSEELVMGGYWSSYWYKGVIYGTEIARGVDVLELVPSNFLSENEIAAANLTATAVLHNPQQQRQIDWPAEPVVALAYMDQLRRDNALPAAQDQALTAALDRAATVFEDGNGLDAAGAEQLEALAVSLAGSAGGFEGMTQKRYMQLASTVREIAARLR